jgi:hypothetical protein
MKCFVKSAIIRATRIITKGLKNFWKQYLEIFYRFPTKQSCTRGIAHNKESVTLSDLKPEWWDVPLVQEEKYQGKGNL